MSHKVVQLVQRLATPAVAAGLAKEELCLALAAADQLKPLSSTTSPDAAINNNTASPSATFMEPLARRSLRLIPQCTPQELRMVARGASALQWPSTTSSSAYVVEALVLELYRHITSRNAPAAATAVPPNRKAACAQRCNSISSSRVRLNDLLAVVSHAMDAGHFFNPTLHMLLTENAVPLACESAGLSAASAQELIAVVCGYLGEKEGVVLIEQLRCAMIASSSGNDSLDKCVSGHPLPLSSTWMTSYARWSQQRDGLLFSFAPSAYSLPSSLSGLSATSNAVDPTTSQQQKARHDVLHVIQRLRSSEESANAVKDDELLSTLEAVKVFHLYDPVTLLTLDATLLQRLTAAASVPATTVSATMENYVYAQAQRYPRALALLRERDEVEPASAKPAAKTVDGGANATDQPASSPAFVAPSEALQHISTIQRVYQKALTGAFITDKDIFLVGNDINAYGADEVAKATFVFAYTRDIPANLILILASTVATLTIDGVVALMRAARQDRMGALRTAVNSCLSNVAALQRCIVGASVESLVELAAVLALPHTRWTTTASGLPSLEVQVRDLVLTQLLLQVAEMPWTSLLCVVRGVGQLPGGQDLVRAACGRLSDHLQAGTTLQTGERTSSLGVSKCLDLVEALQAGDVVDERLLDLLASVLATSFAGLATSTADDLTRHAAFLRLASLELAYEAPELAEVVNDVVRSVAQTRDWTAVPAELLVSAALFSFDGTGVSSFYVSTVSLPHRVLSHLAQSQRLSGRLTMELAAAVVDVMFRLPATDVDSAVAAYCVEAVSSVAAAFPPLTAAKLVCVANRSTTAATPRVFSPDICAAVTANVRGLPADTFSALCRVVANPSFDEGLANRLVEVLPLMADRLTPHQLSRSIFGLGEMRGAGQRLSHQVMTEALSDYAVDNVDLFTSGPDIAALLHGFAKLQCTKRNLYSVFAKQVYRRCVRCTLDHQSISFLLFAFGSVKFVDQRLINFLCQVFVEHAEELAAPDLLMTLRGASRMCLVNGQLYWRLGNEAVKRADEFPLQSQCELLHAYGFIEQRHPEMATALATRIAAKASSLPSASAAVDVVTSLWLMDYKVAGMAPTCALADHIAEHSAELSSQDVLKLCSVICDLQWHHGPLLNAIAARALQLKGEDQLEAVVARAVLDTLALQHVFHLGARTELSQLARSASKEVVLLSGEEQEQLNLLTSH